jgi:hypothetical protein
MNRYKKYYLISNYKEYYADHSNELANSSNNYAIFN